MIRNDECSVDEIRAMNPSHIILSPGPGRPDKAGVCENVIRELGGRIPILGICLGHQAICEVAGATVTYASHLMHGKQSLATLDTDSVLFRGMKKVITVARYHSLVADPQTIPAELKVTAVTEDGEVMAVEQTEKQIYGVQFHPEVNHTVNGQQMLHNFLYQVCGCTGDWTMEDYAKTAIEQIREKVGDGKVLLALSGGVDSSVAAALLSKAVGDQLTCIFVDHGLLRKNEFKNVMHDYECLGLNVIGVDASDKFFKDLEGVTDPEQKRKIIGRDFVEVFNAEAHKITDAKWLAQGTIYPDRIESLNITGKTIKSHHNVGGLPEEMHLSLCEPLQWLFKDEVRRVGRELGIPEHLITRHPFPGPGLAVRILGDITREKVRILQDADDIFIQGLRDWMVKDATGNDIALYHQVWQAGAILLPVQSVGVMGDERTYERAVALRAVTSTDAMTADWAHLPYEFMAKVSNDIINKVKGVNRVCYDISSKPPATIEWE